MKMTDGRTATIVDTDGGVDDVLAIRVAESLAQGPLTVTTVGGNVSADQAAQTVRFMTGLPVHTGLNPHGWQPERRHGIDGVHGAWDGVHRPVEAVDAIDLIAQALTSSSSTIMCLGPLTNLAAALSRVGGARYVQCPRVFALGGVEGAPAGLRDTNRNADPAASLACANIVSWVSMRHAAELSAVKMAEIRDSPDYAWIEPFAERTSQSWGWIDRFPVYDAAVVTEALNPASAIDELIYRAVA